MRPRPSAFSRSARRLFSHRSGDSCSRSGLFPESHSRLSVLPPSCVKFCRRAAPLGVEMDRARPRRGARPCAAAQGIDVKLAVPCGWVGVPPFCSPRASRRPASPSEPVAPPARQIGLRWRAGVEVPQVGVRLGHAHSSPLLGAKSTFMGMSKVLARDRHLGARRGDQEAAPSALHPRLPDVGQHVVRARRSRPARPAGWSASGIPGPPAPPRRGSRRRAGRWSARDRRSRMMKPLPPSCQITNVFPQLTTRENIRVGLRASWCRVTTCGGRARGFMN